LIKAVQPVVTEAKNTTAFKDVSGRLRKSIKVGQIKTKKGTRVIQVGDVDGKAYYGRMVEWGTTKMTPRPYLQPAYERNKDNIISTFRKAIEETMKNL
jgi:HK97 gp10 family phage protein